MNLDDLLHSAQSDLAGVASPDQLEAFRVKYLGTKGLLKDASDHLRDIAKEEKRVYGQKLNSIKSQLAAAYDVRKAQLAAAPSAAAIPTTDITEPGRLRFDRYSPGVPHIITQTISELTALFARMGFTVAEGPEVEDDLHNFIALNIPESHPARDPLDNFYLDRGPGDPPPPQFMVRSQTSSVQIRVMEAQKPPIRIIAPGRVYRPDTVDATHLFMFHQLEALVVDRGVTMVDLRSTIDQFAKAFFGQTAGEVQTRFRPSFFPFTEPSAEVDVLMHLPDGSTKWMEIGGCGMVDPNVFKAVNIDPEVYSGWAFGFGIERLAMRRHHIQDIRLLVENDLRFLRQF